MTFLWGQNSFTSIRISMVKFLLIVLTKSFELPISGSNFLLIFLKYVFIHSLMSVNFFCAVLHDGILNAKKVGCRGSFFILDSK